MNHADPLFQQMSCPDGAPVARCVTHCTQIACITCLASSAWTAGLPACCKACQLVWVVWGEMARKGRQMEVSDYIV